MKIHPKVYIVLVNYNSWKETVDCLESILSNNYTNFEVVVVDNGSINESIQELTKWLTATSVERSHSTYKSDRNQLKLTIINNSCVVNKQSKAVDIIFIASEINTGFAGGNNIAIEYIRKKNDAEFLWLLNNDTTIEENSLINQINFYQKNENKRIGILGSKVRYYHKPNLIQCIGGSSYNRWTGYAKQIGNGEMDLGQYDNKKEKPNLIIGACMLLSKEFLEVIDYLDERYFLYFEEQDLAKVAYDHNFSIDYAVNSVVYHKEGKTIGASKARGKTLFSDFYYTRSKILFTYKFYTLFNRLAIRMSILLTIINRLVSGRANHAPVLIQLMLMPIERLKKTTYDTACNK